MKRIEILKRKVKPLMNAMNFKAGILKIAGVILLLMWFALPSLAFEKDKVFIFGKNSTAAPIGKYTYLFIDGKNTWTEAVIINNDSFELQPKEVPVLKDVTKGTVWLRFSILNESKDTNLFLDIQYANISEIKFYKLIDGKLIKINDDGNSFSRAGHAQKTDFSFALNIPPSDTGKYYLRIKTNHPLILPVYVKNAVQLDQSIDSRNLILGLYFGIIISLVLYNIFLLISTKEISYLFYVAYLFFLGFAQVTVSGYGYTYFWPLHPGWNQYILLLTSCMAGIGGILFAIVFLRIAYYFKFFVYLFFGIIALFVVAMASSFAGNNQMGYSILTYGQMVTGLLLITVSFLIGMKGYRPAYFYFIAWTLFLAGLIVASLRNIGIVPYTTFSAYVLYIGSAIEAIFLSTALADRINILRKEKQQSQVYALKISKENENLIRDQNIVLERKVTERTNELVSANTQLNKTLADLKDAQIQLVEAEKMASLGQLTAGIAHEINNPINFVKSNIKPLNLDIDDLFEVINMYKQLHSLQNGSVEKYLKEIEDKQQEIDIEFVKEEIKQLVKGIEDGAERTAEIVRGLRTFSRLDEGELKVANVHDGIDSTVVLLRNSMPAYLNVVRNFHALGDVECFPGKLNQVFMNIINNSIQAIEEKEIKNEFEAITISTADLPDGKIQIRIKDTGPGMNESVKHRIFEPFFTTKSVGVGTGLGMAIVFKIIEEHHGKIEIDSEPGHGAEFILTLPYIHTTIK